MKQIKSGCLTLLLSSFFILSCRSVPETVPSWPRVKDYFSYYDLDRLQGAIESGWADRKGTKIWTWSVTPEKYTQTVVFIHGYLDHSAINIILYDFLIQKNYRIIAFDLPGHGRSDGQRAGLKSFDEYTESLDLVMDYWNLDYDRTIFMSHSTGGAILLDRLIKDVPMKAVVLAAPLVQFRHFDSASFFLSYLFRGKGMVRVLKKDSCSNEDFNTKRDEDPLRIGRMPLNWPRSIIRWQNSLPEGERNYKGPLLVLQGEEDDVVFYERNMSRIKSWFPQARINYYPQLMHHLLNETDREVLYNDLAVFLDGLD